MKSIRDLMPNWFSREEEDEEMEVRSEPKSFDDEELREIDETKPIRPPVIFEVIRRQGQEELVRPASSLTLSGLAAGLTLGLSVLALALMRAHLPDTPWRPLVENFGYTIGFVIVILGQLQLFTENTITVVCPALVRFNRKSLYGLAQVWSVVFVFNTIGACLFAIGLHVSDILKPEVHQAMISLAEKALGHSWMETMLRGIGAGWLIATLVWIMPNAGSGKVVVIVMVTYIIALAEFAHVIAGGAEAMYLILEARRTFGEAIGGFLLPALIGNIIGGTVLFTLLTFGQIKAELPEDRR